MNMRSFVDFFRGCAKAMLLVLNSFCILTAILTLGFAAADTRILKQYGTDQANGTLTSDIVIIFSCLLLVAVATFGCIGAIRENVKLLYLYVGCLLVLVVLELLVGVYVGVQRYGLELRVTTWLQDSFFGNVTGEELSLKNRLWDEIQTNYECCGLNGPEDYPAIELPISLSCCARAYRARVPIAQKQLYKACIESNTYSTSGCEDEMVAVLRDDADYLLGVAVVSFWFEAAGMVLAMWMANNLQTSVKVYKETVKY